KGAKARAAGAKPGHEARGRNGSMARSAPRSAKRDERAAASVLAEPDTSVGASRGKYVYCIIEASDSLKFGPIGIGVDPSNVYTVHYKNLAAVVSDAPLEVLDSTRENVLAHERVNETVMREHTVIP